MQEAYRPLHRKYSLFRSVCGEHTWGILSLDGGYLPWPGVPTLVGVSTLDGGPILDGGTYLGLGYPR